MIMFILYFWFSTVYWSNFEILEGTLLLVPCRVLPVQIVKKQRTLLFPFILKQHSYIYVRIYIYIHINILFSVQANKNTFGNVWTILTPILECLHINCTTVILNEINPQVSLNLTKQQKHYSKKLVSIL